MDRRQDYFDIIVSGGGLTGLACGLSHALGGLRVLVVDRCDMSAFMLDEYDGRASAIGYGSCNLLSCLGVGDLFSEHGQAIWDIRVADGHPYFGVSEFFLHYSHGDLGSDPFGYIVENVLLRRRLYELALASNNLEIVDGVCVVGTSIESGLRRVVLDTGREYFCSLLVGAEGRFSGTRDLLGIGVYERSYDQTSMVCTVSHECDHGGVAVELFLPSGPFAMLPMLGGRSNVVWSESSSSASSFMALSDFDFLEALRLRFGDWLGEITLVSERFSYPLSLLHAHRYTSERFVLLGDSAHVIHPIAGQGVNLGFRDCAALAESVIDGSRLGLDIGGVDVLSGYESWRRFDTQLLVTVTDSLVRLFSNDNGLLRVLRGAGMAGVNRLPFAKRLLQKHAMGLLGDLPRLLRGESL